MKRLITLTLAVVMVFSMMTCFTSCGEKSDWEKIEEQGFFYCGITVYAPMNYFDDEGNLIYAYDGSELVAPWLFDLQLVDSAGGVLTHEGGNNGYSADWAEFIYPAAEELPEELWLAPVRDGQADMSRAVRVR